MNEHTETIILIEDTKAKQIKEKRVLRTRDYAQVPEFLAAVLRVKEELRQKYPDERYVLREGSGEALSTLAASYPELAVFRESLHSEPMKHILAVVDLKRRKIAEHVAIEVDTSNPSKTFAAIQEEKKRLTQKYAARARDGSRVVEPLTLRALYSGVAGQERFTRFIWAENKRLNDLIRNLYLYFQLEHYSERDLYDHICQEVAEYFRADCCALYLVHYEEQPNSEGYLIEAAGAIRSSSQSRRSSPRHLTKWLELVGASGPWRRVLKEQYVRQRSRRHYQLPGALKVEPCDSAEITGMTRKGFVSEDPTRYASGYDFRLSRSDSLKQELSMEVKLEADTPRQVVWYQDGLYNSCRCSMMVPLAREGRGSVSGNGTSPYRKIGLIKVENRSPYGVTGFSDVSSEGVNQNHLFFPEEWKIAALRPYVRDLRESVKENRDPFLPLHNNVGWQQYFEDNPLAGHYFQQLLQELRQRRKARHAMAAAQELPERYKTLAGWLENLVECLIRTESWLQHLRNVCRLIYGIDGKPSLDRPVPSLFNVHNLRAAYLERLLENSSPSATSTSSSGQSTPSENFKIIEGTAYDLPSLLRTFPELHPDVLSTENGEQKPYAYDVVRDALLDCLAKQNTTAKQKLQTLDGILSAAEKFDCLVQSLLHSQDVEGLKYMSDSQQKVKELIKNFKDLLCQGQGEQMSDKCKTLESLDRDFQVLNRSNIQLSSGELQKVLQSTLVSLNSIRLFAEQEAEDLIQKLCHERAKAMCGKLGTAEQPFDIMQCLDGTLPSWDFQTALNEVLEDLKFICEVLEPQKLEEREFEYELISEEAEVCQIRRIVQCILQENRQEEERYAVACVLSEPHDEPAHTGCKAARALAAATMHADSFHQIDEKRLAFIGCHIAQLLDNHLLHQSRQRGLEVDYGALDVFALEPLGMELLDTVQSYSQRIGSALCHLLEREVYRSGEDTLQPLSELPPLKELVERISEFLKNKDSEQEEWFSHCLVAITYPVVEDGDVGTDVLRKIYDHASRLGLSIKCNQKLTQFTFLPSERLIPNGERRLAESMLCLPEADRNEVNKLELLIGFKGEAIQARDLRALWSVVKVLEDVLKVVEATIGGM